MSDALPPPGDQAQPTAPPPTAPVRRTRWWLWAVLFLLVVSAGGGAAWWRLRPKPYVPPEPPRLPVQEGADPAVVAAVERARQNVLAEPKSAPAWGELGMAFAAHGYEPEAAHCFTEAERLDPADPRWPYFRGLFAAVNQPEQTVAHLRRALDVGSAPGRAIAPDALAVIRLKLAETLFEQGAVDEAESLFRVELARTPDDPRARFGLAQVALTRGDRRAAREAFTALADDPYARKRAASLAAALARADGDLAVATKFEEAARQVREDPSWPDPYLQQLRTREVGQQGLLREVEALEAAGQLPRATQLLLDVVQTDPKPRLLATTGIYLAKIRDYPRAEAMLRECLRLDPGNSQAHYFLCVVSFELATERAQTRPAEARALFQEAVKSGRAAVAAKSDHGLAWLYLGRSLLGLDEPVAAIEALRQAVACRPEVLDTHLYLGEALAATGEKAEAIRSAQNAEKLAKPGDPRPHQLLDRLQAPVTPKK
jgi:tetratricopeptide (TPR) repeat protein